MVVYFTDSDPERKARTSPLYQCIIFQGRSALRSDSTVCLNGPLQEALTLKWNQQTLLSENLCT